MLNEPRSPDLAAQADEYYSSGPNMEKVYEDACWAERVIQAAFAELDKSGFEVITGVSTEVMEDDEAYTVWGEIGIRLKVESGDHDGFYRVSELLSALDRASTELACQMGKVER